MESVKRWEAVCEDGNGKIHIFGKFVNESLPNAVEDFEAEVKAHDGLTILAMYRTTDIIEYTSLDAEGGDGDETEKGAALDD